MAMEASFKSRVEQTFGALLGSSVKASSSTQMLASRPSSSSSAAAKELPSKYWSVSEVAIPCNRGSRGADESSGSDGDEPCAAQYEKFVKLANRGRRRSADDDEEVSAQENDVDEHRVAKRRRSGELEERVLAVSGQEDLDEDEECRQIRLMVGMDDTLDFEEEEDEYDKVAVGREGAGERIYMREITSVGFGMNPRTPLPVSSVFERRHFGRDSRANHAAAAARLKEDDRLATIKNADVAEMLRLSSCSDSGCSKSLSVSEVGMLDAKPAPGIMVDAPLVNGGADIASSSNSKADIGETSGTTHQNAAAGSVKVQSGNADDNLAQNGSDSKREGKVRKVRFTIDDDDPSEENEKVSSWQVQAISAVPLSRNRYGRVPDHVRNPSKYTHYTLDWSDEEDKADLTAFQATWALSPASEKQDVFSAIELPKSIPFTPRSGGMTRKGNQEALSMRGPGLQLAQPLVSFAGEGGIDNSSSPEETSQNTVSKMLVETKPVRVFRKRAREDDTGSQGDAA